MKGDLFIRTLLIIIVTLLVLNVLLPTLSNPPTSYAAKNIEYKVFTLSSTEPNAAQILFNEYGKEGWEYVGQIAMTSLVIFKR
jgi:hypothetical protein